MADDDLDEVTQDRDQSPTTGSSQLLVVVERFTSGHFHGFVRTSFQDGVLDTWNTALFDSFRSRIRTCAGDFGPGLVDTHPVHNEADRFTVSPLMISNVQNLIR